MRAAFAGASRARIERVSVGRGVENLGIVLETVLGAIAMVDVEVEDRNTADVLTPRRRDPDCHVVEEAEPHGTRVFRVMPGWTHHGYRVLGSAVEDAVDALDDGSGRGASGHHGVGRDVGVGIQVAAAGRRSAIEHRHVPSVMDAMQHGVGYRGSRLRCETEATDSDRIQNRGHPLRALGMTLGVVPGVRRIGQQGDHSMVRARKRSTCNAAKRSMPAFSHAARNCCSGVTISSMPGSSSACRSPERTMMP